VLLNGKTMQGKTPFLVEVTTVIKDCNSHFNTIDENFPVPSIISGHYSVVNIF